MASDVLETEGSGNDACDGSANDRNTALASLSTLTRSVKVAKEMERGGAAREGCGRMEEGAYDEA